MKALRVTLVLAAGALAALPSLAQDPSTGGDGEPAAATDEAAAPAGEADAATATLFAENCASCHSVPDRALRTDRAWLDQVRRTT